MRRGRAARVSFAAAGLALGVGAAGACIPGTGPALDIEPLDGGPPGAVDLGSDASVSGAVDVDLGDPFALVGVTPSHGPYTGGTRATLVGRGFSSKLRVWIGGTELAPSAIFASDPTQAAIETPPGPPGPADVTIRDDATAKTRTLPGAFFYDAFVVQPSSGSTTGGTRITIVGKGTAWTTGANVTIGGSACSGVTVTDATHLTAITPPGSPGVQDVTVVDASGSKIQARDAYTYSDSPDGYRGGLTGGSLGGKLTVLAFDAYAGSPIPLAYAIAGSLTKLTNTAGIASFDDPSLTGKVTVTVAGKCHQPVTFVDVPVDTVTAYLTPTFDPACASGDPPSIGGHGGENGGEIDGELVFPGVEFAPGAWTVPEPVNANERRAAYVYTASGSPSQAFYLPTADQAVTPDKVGAHGYTYAILAPPGNVTEYALAGIEDRSVTPPKFTAYVMGVARGISLAHGAKVDAIDIPMNVLLDHAVTLSPSPPQSTPRGPDRLDLSLSVTIGQGLYASLPNGAATRLLPVSGDVSFVGVPALDGSLAGERYAVGASAVTTSFAYPPESVVALVKTSDSNDPIAIGGFLQPPTIAEPSSGAWGGTHVSFASTGQNDLVEVVVTSGGGLVTWVIAAPGGTTSFDLPDLRPLTGNVGLVAGPISTNVYVARLDGFAYGALLDGQLSSGSWSAYAFDSVSGAY